MITAKDLAVHYMKGAQVMFAVDGEVMPIIAFHGGPTEFIVQLRPNPKFHPSDQSCAIAFAFSTVIEASHLVTVNETWMKKFDPDEQPESMDRGYLEELHEQGDTDVHTALLVIAGDLRDHTNSYVMTRDVDEGDLESTEEWTQQDLGLMQGSMLDRLLYAWDHGQEIPKEGAMDWPWIATTLAKMEVISQVAVFGREDNLEDLADFFARMKAGEN